MIKLQYCCEYTPLNSNTLESIRNEDGIDIKKYPTVTFSLDDSPAKLGDLLDLIIIPFIQACGYKCDELYTEEELEEEISYRLKKEE